MMKRSGRRRGITIILATLALATAACGAPPTTGPITPVSLDQDATATPEGSGVAGATGTGGGSNSDGGGSGSGGSGSGGSGSGGSGGGGTGGGGTSGGGTSGGGTSGGGTSGGGGDTGTGSGGGGTGGGDGGTGGGGETGSTNMSPAECLYGKWKQQAGTWRLPGSSWGLSGTVTVNFASSTNTQQNVILFERNADVGRNVYTEDLEANYTQGYGNPQPSLTLSGRDYGDFSVSGSTVTFSNGSTIQMTYRMDSSPVSTKNVKRLVTTAEVSCSSSTLELSASQFTGTYTRLY